jgi:hypothetical protein
MDDCESAMTWGGAFRDSHQIVVLTINVTPPISSQSFLRDLSGKGWTGAPDLGREFPAGLRLPMHATATQLRRSSETSSLGNRRPSETIVLI